MSLSEKNKSNADTFLAVVIELHGDMLDSALSAWEQLDQKLSINSISSRSYAPHVTLKSGIQCEISELSKIAADVTKRCSVFSLQGNGLGVFVADTPVVHIRWILNDELLALREMLTQAINSAEQRHVITYYEDDNNWQAKSTLAFTDSSYDKLPETLKVLEGIDFRAETIVSELSIYEYGKQTGEKKLLSFSFG